MTLQALRERVGDDDFFAILRTWIDEHRDDTASTADFVALVRAGVGRGARRAVRRVALRAPTLPDL